MREKLENSRESEALQQFLFVYGTLMRGGGLHHLLSSASEVRFVGEGKIHARLYRLPGKEYPGAVRATHGGHFVHGEIYELRGARNLLTHLDEAEGCAEGLFVRRIVDVFRDGKKVKAWTYFYGKSVAGAEPLPKGRFLPARATAAVIRFG